MKTPQVDIFFASFPYGGNGGVSCEHPSIRKWFAGTLLNCKSDERIGKVHAQDFCDTPITMTRNAAVLAARQHKADFLCMVDSDQWPDLYLGKDPGAKPFWDSSFDFSYQRLLQGKCTVVGAPYCGPPPIECVYVFKWANFESDNPGVDHRLEMFGREEAAQRGGIEEVAALPTGLILFDMRVFDLIEPPYFYYEYEDRYEAKKASTEDVTATRDIALHGQEKLGYSPIHCNWDAWAGHMKPKCVGKPRVITVEAIGAKYRRALATGAHEGERMMEVDFAADQGIVPFAPGSDRLLRAGVQGA